MSLANIDNKKLNFDSVLTFGKYKGETIEYVFQINASYLQWCLKNIERFKLSEKETKLIIEKAEIEDEDRYVGAWYDDDWGDK